MISENNLSHKKFYAILQRCATLPQVHEEVCRNHDNNQWWPLTVSDWRLRLVVAGWSTRVSYHMITTYQRVVAQAHALGYDQLVTLSDEAVEEVVASLGLAQTRVAYFRSVTHFVEQFETEGRTLAEYENNQLVERFATSVRGAGYKVAQCAILYAKGYHCGIFPVDSGMKDMLGPCLGLSLPKTPIGHEVMRKHLEGLLQTYASDYSTLAEVTGYGDLALPKDRAPIWWAHLVLIYFKRRFCNRHLPSECPLRNVHRFGDAIGTMCDRHNPEPGGSNYVQCSESATGES
jgi:hypothetical protein